MDRLHYAGHSVITGTAIAHALLGYAQALAQANGSATVQIPTVNDDGSPGRSEMLVGPSSQLISDAEESEHEEVTDEVLVTYLREEAVTLRTQGMPSSVAEIRKGLPAREWPDFEL
ncbi:hypothetical protein [Microbacterium deminutum]|uniref:Uncharacterized protein n=1 Tax=Microbacterium deminutum TaxID=344164 RepID=A0ABN2R2I7_9MICO